jgi:hypothetical protein
MENNSNSNSNSNSLNIIIVEKNASLKMQTIKDFKEDELYKKCGFKKPDGFIQQTQWSIKLTGAKYLVQVYAKTEGRSNSENKYDFPPPIDTKLFFGNCAITAKKQDLSDGDGNFKNTNLSLELWEKMYEKLFGGFEDLTLTIAEDENEIDELANVPKDKKTKDGYLKDGFVLDSSDTDDESSQCNGDNSENDVDEDDTEDLDCEEELDLEILGSELSEDDYDYETSSDEDIENIENIGNNK